MFAVPFVVTVQSVSAVIDAELAVISVGFDGG
jgi:hypothetical protein